MELISGILIVAGLGALGFARFVYIERKKNLALSTAVLESIKRLSAREDTQVSQPVDLGKSSIAAAYPEVGKWVGWDCCGHLDVSGVNYRIEDAISAISISHFGDNVELERDPSNENAIEVWLSGFHVGFIDRGIAALINAKYSPDMPIKGKLIDTWESEGGYIRVTILPQMPASKYRKSFNWEVSK